MWWVNLLIPLVMIGFGGYFIKRPPREINWVYGYRTSMSMKNKDTWVFAHRHCGKLWLVFGLILLALSLGAMLVFPDGGNTVLLILMGVQLAVLIAPIFLTEHALRKTFDKDGNRRR